jgi:AraC family transcriptional regulator of adaptative response/methylated-DNA-[protein]-cysteine methyltransferase
MSSDYARIERAIEFLVERAQEQPSLEDTAALVGLSAPHFQRLFTRWAGVSPKRFVQFLSLERAKACLEANRGVLVASAEAGLSGPGRLHDLFLAHETLSPGEYRRGGEGVSIRHGWVDSPFGDALVLVSPRGLCGLAFAVDGGHDGALQDMRRRWPLATFSEDPDAIAALAAPLFDPSARPRLALDLRGTPFQLKVWEALLRIPPGALVSYDALALAVTGSARGARAVGTAVGANPVSLLVPCHRVIHRSGIIGRYHWGRPRKLAMIGWEAARPSKACDQAL